jgi:predicted acetylornithine/succinylornithine family transaminase
MKKKSHSTSRTARRKSIRPAKAAVRANDILRDADRFLVGTYKRAPVVFTHGRGCRIFDSAGKSYLDFLGGIAVNALGHAHPRIVRVIQRQAARAIHFSNLYHHEFQGPLARRLAQWSGLDRVFFSNSGSEAMEGALKLARLCGQSAAGNGKPRYRILALENSFHGRTFGALSITSTEKYRAPFAPLVPGAEFVPFNDVAALEARFRENGSCETICALVIEPVQGEGGIHAVSEAFWNRARALCTQHGALLIADEIQCGLGRTGRAFGFQQFSSLPDLAVVAKPLAAGLPLGAILASEAVAARISPGLHGTTFGGGPLACATALEFLAVVEEEKLLENVRARGAELRSGLERLKTKFPFIREIRGQGLMLGVELSIEGGPLVGEAMSQGLLINCTHDYTLRLLPPFIVSKAEVSEFLQRFEAVLAAAAVNDSAARPSQEKSVRGRAAAR